MNNYSESIQTFVDSVQSELQEVSFFLFDNPEIGFKEKMACQKLVKVLNRCGFDVVFPAYGVETAFHATIAHTALRPHIAILAEYDALPDLGHACGHNLIATAALGAGLALKQILPPLSGRVSVIGTPAEEVLSDSGKMRLVDAGAFKDVDIAMVTHPHGYTWLGKPFLAVNEIQVIFSGKSSHAASSPHMGINAFDAMQLTFNGISYLRQQLRQDTRIHWGDLKVSGAKNVIPDGSSAAICIRASDDAYTSEVTSRVIDCIRGAALMTGCNAEYQTVEGFRAMKLNHHLDTLIGENFKLLGLTLDELPQHGRLGSTDMGNVSKIVPSTHPFYKITDKVGAVPHTVEFCHASNTEQAFEATLLAAKALAMTAADLLLRPDRVEKAWEVFRSS